MEYFRPIAMTDPARPVGALPLAGGWGWFDRVEVLRRDGPARLIPASDLDAETRDRLSGPRPDFGGLAMTQPLSLIHICCCCFR